MPLLLRLVLLFSFILPVDSSAGSPPTSLYDQLNSFQQSYWLKLLHYDNGISRADGEHFFLAVNGKTDPAAELEFTIRAFKNTDGEAGWFKYHPQCVFRERYQFLRQAGLLTDAPVKNCPQFEDWKKGLNADSITLIFSSSYPNNPSSLFGHTMIRLNQKEKSNDLLDYAVAFSAMPSSDDIGVVFAFKGMFGGYKGLLEVTKYYTKVNEYNNGESRDLIEYDINMTNEELDRLINHLWEIYQTTYFDYYFADENCSAVLVDILAVPFANDKVNSHRRWYYLPSEMIKTFRQIPGRIKSEHFRPSLKKQLEKKLDKLSSDELKAVRSQDILSPQTTLPVLDGVISLLDFIRYRTKDNLSEEEAKLLRKALIKRSSLAQDTLVAPLIYNQKNRPDLGHEPQKFAVFLRTENSDFLPGIEFKQGYHDLMSRDLGYDPFSQFDFFTGSLLYDRDKKIARIDQLTFVDLISLHPYQFYDPQFSWAAKLVYDRIYDLDCQHCHRLDARAYLGPTLKPTPQMVATVMIGSFLEVAKHFARGVRAGLGIEASVFYQYTDLVKMGLFDEIRSDAISKLRQDYYNKAGFKLSYFPKINNEWRFESTTVSKYKSFKKSLWLNQLNYGFYF
jgi:hypothetical protein